MTLDLRPITGPDEIDLFNAFPYVLNREVAGDLEAGRRHHHWLWLALDGDRPVARAGFWSRPGDPEPFCLDIFDLTDPGAGVALLEKALATAGRPEQYLRFVPPDWHDDPEARRETELRLDAMARTGAKLLVERLRLQWEPGTPIAPPSGRLLFREPAGADELLGLMVRVLDGTLDAHSRDELTRMTPQEQARTQYDEELSRYVGPRDRWRVATLPDGSPVGFVIPSHNGYNHVLAYIGVVPEFRGRGLVDDLLAEGTRLLAADHPPRIRASTDLGNVPMAKAFARNGYAVHERQLDMIWP
ncbi:GNAT family N-acetyltransferase [Symbioplanes lichenis]|uniref:GNAT family N-acetyltransferase n=1 Tax=Symbioplanes lichenis TaxID=1629072 RepID=UPI00273A3D12|nr:GNAT family N-acetyltransferase [Actinoplanes lichenis]